MSMSQGASWRRLVSSGRRHAPSRFVGASWGSEAGADAFSLAGGLCGWPASSAAAAQAALNPKRCRPSRMPNARWPCAMYTSPACAARCVAAHSSSSL